MRGPKSEERMIREFCWLVGFWVICAFVIGLSFSWGCTPRPRRDLVDPYQHDFTCKIKWCQPEPKR